MAENAEIDARLAQLRALLDDHDRDHVRSVAGFAAYIQGRDEIVSVIGEVKADLGADAMQPARHAEVRKSRAQWYVDAGVVPELAYQLVDLILDHSIAHPLKNGAA